ncbi:MAG: sialate O-acetylesterase [Lachnospirales bacterium]
MHGVIITKGVSDWQIVQHKSGFANLTFQGTYSVPQAAIEVGVKEAYPIIRILNEDDNYQICPWSKVYYTQSPTNYEGTWSATLTVPAGGLYKIETGLKTISTKPDLQWIFRGDVRLHIGIGDIFVIAGQSNASGYGRDSAYDPPHTKVHLFRNRGTWDLACHPINESTAAEDCINKEMGVSGTSPFITFGKEFYKISQYPVGLIPTALGGSPISRWDTQVNGDLYYNMINKIKKCGNEISGILWYQGCSDTTPLLSPKYYQSFLRLVENTRKDLFEVPFFTFQLNRQFNAEYNEDWGVIREAQRQTAINIPKVYILPTLHCSLCDGIHNSSHANIMLGNNLAKLCGNVIYNKEEFFAPNIIKAEAKENIIYISFSNLNNGFIQINNNINNSTFLIEDSKGNIPLLSYSTFESDNAKLQLKLGRNPIGTTTISYGWSSDPSHIPFYDEKTFLPILSFYKFPVEIC